MAKAITALLLGAGLRGAEAYGPYALAYPDQLRFVAVAEPDPIRRESFSKAHNIPVERQYSTWQDAIESPKIADIVINATQDNIHHASGIAAMEAGYDMLLEKPIASTLQDTVDLIRCAETQGRLLQICHVLRYTDFFNKVREIVQSGCLGQLITISHRENVSSWHMAHSFVRGNWRRSEESTPMILAKCCHDLDLIYWIVGLRPSFISSFGSLHHFRSEYAPPGAPERCTDGCPAADECPFYAPEIYISLTPIKEGLSQAQNPFIRFAGKLSLSNPKLFNTAARLIYPLRELSEYTGWPRSAITNEPASEEALVQALQEGLYGRCVYFCDNNVVDNQIVSIEFPNGTTATLTMHGHSHEEGRTLRLDGSQATLLGKFSFNQTFIEIHDHRSLKCERIDFPNELEGNSGHGGGDFGVLRKFISSLHEPTPSTSEGRESLESHLMAFAAEQSRISRTTVDMNLFREQAESLTN